MQLDLTRYRRPVSSFERTFSPGDVGDDADAYRVVEPVALAFEISKDKDRFRLVGALRSALELTCSRCLEAYRLPVDSSFDLRYLPAGSGGDEEGEREVVEDDLETSYYRDEQIDLNELIREQFYLVLPMKPLCRDDCKGLCPRCGTNVNIEACGCSPSWEDPRLAALRSLRKDA